MKKRIVDFWKKYEYAVILLLGFILASGLSFEAGVLQGQKIKENPLIIEKSIENPIVNNLGNQKPPEGQNLLSEEKNIITSATIKNTECAFVGSKNSNKYHLPTCRWAKSIKPENLVCFSDENDAKSKGYLPDKNCIK